MGKIVNEVLQDHLTQYPREREVIAPFLTGFDINWARKRRTKNTSLSIYFIHPENSITDLFGFSSPILLAISDYPDVQPRTMQAIEQFIQEDPALGRVDQTVFFLVSRSKEAESWVREYTSVNPQSRIAVVFERSELTSSPSDPWLIRSIISRQLYSRDLFNDQLPLVNDLFFFGRSAIAAEFLSSVKQSQNRGLFGLRKTGKTSLLFKIQRLAERKKLQHSTMIANHQESGICIGMSLSNGFSRI